MAQVPVEQKELTVRGLILGVVITVLFTAANVFFGLKAGITFSTSIPAAVISMAILRSFKGSTIQENNIVQTVASSAGTLSSIIFILPSLVIIGWWTGFPFWTSSAICALGGMLGVLYSIPLRRALVTTSDLPYPEGVACAEVLKVGGGADAKADAIEEAQAGLWALVVGSVSSGVFAVIVGTRVFASDFIRYFRFGAGVSGFDLLLSPALFGIGHLVGLWVGMAIFVGELIAWLWGVPYFSAGGDLTHVDTLASTVWRHQVRFVGAGTILIAALWTLGKLVVPVYSGMRATLAASRAARNVGIGNEGALPSTERDLPMGVIALLTLICLAPIPFLLARFDVTGVLSGHITALVVGGMIYIILVSFLVSSVCGYMAGLIGSSNSPLSGIGILGTIGAALLLAFTVRAGQSVEGQHALVGYALFVTCVIFAVAAIANNNLQDLKTGQLVGATPWKQQVALFVGVIAGAVIIPPVLDLLNHAYGFAGAPGPVREHALSAPQAGLMAALAQGVLQGSTDWSLIRLGAEIGAGIIVVDMLVRRLLPGAHLSPLAVGLGIYLPTSATLMVVVGSIVGWFYDRLADKRTNPASVKQLGVLLASGLIVGEGLIGVLIAGAVAFSGKDYPIGLVGDKFADGPAVIIGTVAFAIAIAVMYRWVIRLRR